MSPANKDALLWGTGCLLIFVGGFAKLFGLPELLGPILSIAGGLVFLGVVRLRKKVKTEREKTGQTAPIAPLAARKKLFWMVALSLILGSVGMLPLLPYTVDNFQPWIYYWVIPAQIVFLALFLPFLWKKWTSIDRRS
jgi:hypothetical protein